MEAKFINESLNDRQIDELLQWGRKEINLQDVPDNIISDLDEYHEVSYYLDGLPYIEHVQLPAEPGDLMSFSMEQNGIKPTKFTIDGEDGRQYVVDTSGYDNPRYVAGISE